MQYHKFGKFLFSFHTLFIVLFAPQFLQISLHAQTRKCQYLNDSQCHCNMLLAGDIRGSAVKYVVGMTTLVIVYIALTDTTIPPAVDLVESIVLHVVYVLTCKSHLV